MIRGKKKKRRESAERSLVWVRSCLVRSLCCQVAGPQEGFPAKGALENELPPQPTTSRMRDQAEPPLSPSLEGSALPRLLQTIARSAGSLALLQKPTGRIR